MKTAVNLFENRQEPYIYVSQFFHTETVTKHSHDFYEFVYIDSGLSVHNLNDNISILIPGDAFGIGPGDFHSYFNVKDSKIYNCLFHREAVKDYIEQLSLLPGLKDIISNHGEKIKEKKKVHLDIRSRQEIAMVLNSMQSECINLNVGYELKLKAHLLDFLVLMARSYETSNEIHSSNEYSQTKAIINSMQYIENNYNKKIRMEELSTISGMGVDYFSRNFKSLCGITPSSYILYLRISKASELLLNSKLTISDISSMTGFEDSNYFARTFKKATGLSPIAYRQKH